MLPSVGRSEPHKRRGHACKRAGASGSGSAARAAAAGAAQPCMSGVRPRLLGIHNTHALCALSLQPAVSSHMRSSCPLLPANAGRVTQASTTPLATLARRLAAAQPTAGHHLRHTPPVYGSHGHPSSVFCSGGSGRGTVPGKQAGTVQGCTPSAALRLSQYHNSGCYAASRPGTPQLCPSPAQWPPDPAPASGVQQGWQH